MSYAKYNQQIYVCKDKKLTKKMAVQTKRIVLFFFLCMCVSSKYTANDGASIDKTNQQGSKLATNTHSQRTRP